MFIVSTLSRFKAAPRLAASVTVAEVTSLPLAKTPRAMQQHSNARQNNAASPIISFDKPRVQATVRLLLQRGQGSEFMPAGRLQAGVWQLP